ncbi:hypothetical protein N7447_000390 [Penicillium robsamsonii]|uniref:uncharacterized protein n=1 Tax=Penicillium robsamsonii TaxID=1792511 RepID=UPI00254660EC|nr:uncharacterized protein N7447_000390 [Penicillium robsamsonii]KAJ5834364.1 hypothetical protein N7447_000390 [Penicillium robsamsonii]
MESNPFGKRQECGQRLFLFWSKFKWMLANLASPEWALGKAWSDRRSVALLEGRFEKYQREDGVPWSRSHIYYANMGGFSIRFDKSLSKSEFHPLYVRATLSGDFQKTLESVQKISKKIGAVNWELDFDNTRTAIEANTMAYQEHSSDEMDEEKMHHGRGNWFDLFDNIHYLCGNLWVLDANQLLLARELGIIERLPSLSQASLGDRNKGDLILTILALVNISWMLIQLIIRLAQDRPSSQLEIFTVSFAICSVITYILLIDKPKDVQTSYTIKASKRPSPSNLFNIAKSGPSTVGLKRTNIWIPNNTIHLDSQRQHPLFTMYLGSTVALIVFGATHCIAWEFRFPTEAEKLCWHISTVITAGAFPLIWALDLAAEKVIKLAKEASETSDAKEHRLSKMASLPYGAAWSIGVVFLLARLFITVEAFRSLAFLPPDAFLST